LSLSILTTSSLEKDMLNRLLLGLRGGWFAA
jgi:hypothetical protein